MQIPRRLSSITSDTSVMVAGLILIIATSACSSSAPGKSSTSAVSSGAVTSAAAAVPTTLSAAQTLQIESAKSVVISLLKTLNGGVEPDPKDVECITAKVPADQITQLMSAALGQGKLDPTLVQPVLTAIFSCNPRGLAESLSQGLGVLPDDLTPTQRECVASATLAAIASDPALLQKVTQSTSLSALSPTERSTLVASLKTKLSGCSLPPNVTDNILKGIAA